MRPMLATQDPTSQRCLPGLILCHIPMPFCAFVLLQICSPPFPIRPKPDPPIPPQCGPLLYLISLYIKVHVYLKNPSLVLDVIPPIAWDLPCASFPVFAPYGPVLFPCSHSFSSVKSPFSLPYVCPRVSHFLVMARRSILWLCSSVLSPV